MLPVLGKMISRKEIFHRSNYFVITVGILIILSGCVAGTGYSDISVSDRRLNLSGLEAVSIQYLNSHPEEFHAFSSILTAADDALEENESITRGKVMLWIGKQIEQAHYEPTMPVYHFLKTVYLESWEGAHFTMVDESDRELLYDLISAVMGGMNLCSTCSTSKTMGKK